ncbi:cytosolic non-specific dipeptidase-like [Chironomus tepperi]|uniref:cytosolic non-specific dipeptidase-like n=1 Tax=Chironomus tepperi TaxID=113505 RepID=UPI00391F3EAA
MNLPDSLSKLFAYIDNNKVNFIETLIEAVAIKSVSAWPHTRTECQRMIDWAQHKMEVLNISCKQVDIGSQDLPDGTKIKLPNILTGTLGNDPAKKTVLVYGHLDVQPAAVEDGWDTDPFVLTPKDGKLYGRGSSDDKGPILCWLNAIEAYQRQNLTIPVNIKFVFEGMEESGSIGLHKCLMSMRRWFDDVDYACITDSRWLGNYPCVTYGLRGLAHFNLDIECAKMDMHSGVYGGTVYEAMTDLFNLMSQLVDVNGKILVPGVYDDVEPVKPDEDKIYEKIVFDVNDYKKSIGAPGRLLYENKKDLLQHRWRFPALSIHGISGAHCKPGQKTVIPGKVTGKFSIRLVPNQDPNKIEALVVDYLTKKFKESGSPNVMKCQMSHGVRAFTENPNNHNFQAAIRATEHVYGVEPNLIREGSTIPVTLTFQEVTGKNVLLLPIGCGDDGAHSQNEKINERNFIEGSKVLGAYLYELSKIL